jgi:hypothetical protein
MNSPGVNSSVLEDFGNDDELNMYCVSIFDTRTENSSAPEAMLSSICQGA